jgi:esterase/lipase superfamily enzyme
MAILIITNRNVRKPHKDHRAFGDYFNSKGPMELRMATAKKTGSKWRVDIVPEIGISATSKPSTRIFHQFRDNLIDKKRNCVLFVHGFNQDLEKNLEKCREIEDYGVDVVAFSWPANPGGFKPIEYIRARRAAELSAPALGRVFEKLITNFQCLDEDEMLRCKISYNFIAHSLGNYLFQNFIEKRLLDGETRLFDNIILHQADVNNRRHGRWVSQLRYARRVYVTHNEGDKVLDTSDIVMPNRLGNTTGNSEVRHAKYIDFTDAKHVGRNHRLWFEAKQNTFVKAFFKDVFNGRRGEAPLQNSPNGPSNVFIVP